jgi:hypothetical protein
MTNKEIKSDGYYKAKIRKWMLLSLNWIFLEALFHSKKRSSNSNVRSISHVLSTSSNLDLDPMLKMKGNQVLLLHLSPRVSRPEKLRKDTKLIKHKSFV